LFEPPFLSRPLSVVLAVAAGKPLEITTVQLDGPRDGEINNASN